MTQEAKQRLADIARNFRMPQYREIPDVGLYLEQTTKYISETLAPLQEGSITASMISNYVKKGMISCPVKKQYSRDQIIHLMFITLAKSVVSLDNLARFIRLQERTYTVETAYDYLCRELENMLLFTFGAKDTVEQVGKDSTDEKIMLRTAIIAISQKIYLDKCFEILAAEEK